MPRVTIVIATYNRPALLTRTITSVLNQTVSDWVLLVIGDCCDSATEEAVRSFGDDRIFYVNLAGRCGEQSGPNTAGMYSARTKYVALANHDDVWLPDHLEKALAVLEAGDAEFYAGAAAVSIRLKDGRTGEPRFGIGAITPENRSQEFGFGMSPSYFEPASSWVMQADLLRKVGAWRPAATLYRTPLEDWILRAWRADVACYFDNRVTTIYCNSNLGASEGTARNYGQGDEESRYWLDMIARHGVDNLRTLFEDDAKHAGVAEKIFRNTFRNEKFYWVYEQLQQGDAPQIFKVYGWDGFDQACRIVGAPKGFRLRQMLKRRTGEDLPAYETWREVSNEVKATLEADPHWQKVFGE